MTLSKEGPDQSTDFNSTFISEEQIEEQKFLNLHNMSSGFTLNENYGVTGEDPYEAFEAFYDKFHGIWIKGLVRKVHNQKGLDREDVEQYLLAQAWVAATDSSYSAEKGKSIIGWIHQRVKWAFCGLLKTRKMEGALEDFRSEYNDLEPEDYCKNSKDRNDSPYMNGSVSLSDSHSRMEAIDLIKRVVEVIKELPYEYRSPILELFDPSDHFLSFIEREDNHNIYEGAARFEVCSSRSLFKYTGSNAFNMKVAVHFLKEQIPELASYSF